MVIVSREYLWVVNKDHRHCHLVLADGGWEGARALCGIAPIIGNNGYPWRINDGTSPDGQCPDCVSLLKQRGDKPKIDPNNQPAEYVWVSCSTDPKMHCVRVSDGWRNDRALCGVVPTLHGLKELWEIDDYSPRERCRACLERHPDLVNKPEWDARKMWEASATGGIPVTFEIRPARTETIHMPFEILEMMETQGEWWAFFKDARTKPKRVIMWARGTMASVTGTQVMGLVEAQTSGCLVPAGMFDLKYYVRWDDMSGEDRQALETVRSVAG